MRKDGEVETNARAWIFREVPESFMKEALFRGVGRDDWTLDFVRMPGPLAYGRKVVVNLYRVRPRY